MARQRGELCLRIARERRDVAFEGRALALLGNLAQLRGDSAAATTLLDRSLACARTTNDRWAEGRALDMLAVVALHGGDLDTAEECLQQSVGVSRAAQDGWSLGISLNALGDVARLRGHTARATASYLEALELQRAIGVPGPCAIIQSNLGHLAHQDGLDQPAATLFAQALPQVQMYGRDGDVIGCLVGVGGISYTSGRVEQAAQLFGAIEAGLERSGERLWPTNRDAYERDMHGARQALGDIRFDAARTSGRTMDLDSAVRNGLDLLRDVIESPVATLGARGRQPRGLALTPRERQIATLVRRGLSNRQIADELVIAEKTAINHVAHVLDKLGVHSRAQLIARAAELGLDSQHT
jgi:DNA-binding CsgD family transcriptional regulator